MALSDDGKARAGMGADVAWLDGSARPTIAVTNFEGEMVGLFAPDAAGAYRDRSVVSGTGGPSRNRLGFGCAFADIDLDGAPDLVVVNGHIDATVRNIRDGVGHAQAPHLFLNRGRGRFEDVAATAGSEFAQARVARGLACGDFDRDGDVDLLVTTNNGPAVLFRNDQLAGRRSVRLRLRGTRSNRDAIGALVRVEAAGTRQTQMVKGGSSYLSQSELPLTFGVGGRDRVDRVIVTWPSGRVEDFTSVATGRAYDIVEGMGLAPAR